MRYYRPTTEDETLVQQHRLGMCTRLANGAEFPRDNRVSRSMEEIVSLVGSELDFCRTSSLYFG